MGSSISQNGVKREVTFNVPATVNQPTNYFEPGSTIQERVLSAFFEEIREDKTENLAQYYDYLKKDAGFYKFQDAVQVAMDNKKYRSLSKLLEIEPTYANFPLFTSYRYGTMPLSHAIKINDLEAFKILIHAGADMTKSWIDPGCGYEGIVSSPSAMQLLNKEYNGSRQEFRDFLNNYQKEKGDKEARDLINAGGLPADFLRKYPSNKNQKSLDRGM